MPIVAINVAIRVNPVTVPCPPPGGVFTVRVTVTGRAVGRGGSYDVEIYDQDAIIDDLLAGSYANGVLPGNLWRQHIFFLKCDPKCDVAGPLGTSGENTAEIYAWANGGRNVTAMSQVVGVTCAPSAAGGTGKRPKGRSKREKRTRGPRTRVLRGSPLEGT